LNLASFPPKTFPVRQITRAPQGHILANRNVWSSDGKSIVYDVRDEETDFTGNRIERVFVDSGEVEIMYVSPGRSTCGVPTCCPIDDRYVFIHSPLEDEGAGVTNQWQYCAWHRHGVIGHLSKPQQTWVLDARDVEPPFTPGALRGGTHLHMFSPCGKKVASTYEDHVLAISPAIPRQENRRVIAITMLDRTVSVPRASLNNLDGSFTAVVTDVVDAPEAGSDQIYRAYSEAWIDSNRLAYQADVRGRSGKPHSELYVVTLPRDWMRPGPLRLEGTETTRCGVPEGIQMRRLTFTDNDSLPGLSGPRHWAIASPDGSWIGCFRRDTAGHSQFHVVNSLDGEMRQISSHPFSATSAFTWHPNGKSVAYVADGSVMQLDLATGEPKRLTPNLDSDAGPTHHACIFSPNGDKIAYMQMVQSSHGSHTQLFCVEDICR